MVLAADRVAGEPVVVPYAACDGMLDLLARAASAATSAPTAVKHATLASGGVGTRLGPQ